MALKRNERYPGRFENPTTAQPQGAFKNRTSPTSQDGSYLEADWVNDWSGFFGRLLTLAGVTPNGNVDTASTSQYYDALKSLFLQRANPFADIKSDGTVNTALKNLSLGTAATKNVGNGVGQIPDMSSFSLVGDETAGAMRFPNGFKLVWGDFSLAVGGGAWQTVTFYSAFSTACVAVIPAVHFGASQMIGISAVTLTNATLSKGNLDSDERAGRYIAIGY